MTVMVRPEWIVPLPDPNGDSTVVDREYFGHDQMLEIGRPGWDNGAVPGRRPADSESGRPCDALGRRGRGLPGRLAARKTPVIGRRIVVGLVGLGGFVSFGTVSRFDRVDGFTVER